MVALNASHTDTQNRIWMRTNCRTDDGTISSIKSKSFPLVSNSYSSTQKAGHTKRIRTARRIMLTHNIVANVARSVAHDWIEIFKCIIQWWHGLIINICMLCMVNGMLAWWNIYTHLCRNIYHNLSMYVLHWSNMLIHVVVYVDDFYQFNCLQLMHRQ